MLNKQKSNMYNWVTKTRNFIGGRCPHNCEYCLTSGTKILMSNFTIKNIEDIKIGDSIIGLKKNKTKYYKFAVSTVKNIFKRISKTIIIKTKHNTLQVTPEHLLMGSTEVRNCSDWRMAKNYSPYQHLRYITTPKIFTQQKKIGWITGFCDGDGCFFKYNKQQGFEAVCTDERLSDVFINTCNELGIKLRKSWKISSKKSFNKGGKNPMITTRAIEPTKKLKELVQFPSKPSIEFMKGYLAGMLDTDGSVSGHSIRIAQSKIVNKIKYNRIILCCKSLGLEYREEKQGIRILANLKKRLNFVFDFGSQHSKKRDCLILGYSNKGSYHSEIISINKGNKTEVYNLETECENFIANGFIVHNCYVESFRFPLLKKKYSGKLRLVESEFKKPLGSGNTIFICSCNDMFAKEVPTEWIKQILTHCLKYSDNKYLFQTKNPERMHWFYTHSWFPVNSIFGTTIETNRPYKLSKAPDKIQRAWWLSKFKNTMVSIEPITDFEIIILLDWIKNINPLFVSIGADSKNHNLKEPSSKKIKALIKELRKFTNVKIKINLRRLLK